jgi:hypothetical protein
MLPSNNTGINFQFCRLQNYGKKQPRSQGFSLFVIGKAGKGPGTGRSSMYSDWSMTEEVGQAGRKASWV